MFIFVKHQRQQQEIKFWFPAIGAYQLLQARELVYRIDDLSSWTLNYIVSFNFRACKIDLFEPTCQAICLAAEKLPGTLTVMFVYRSRMLMSVYGQNNYSFCEFLTIFCLIPHNSVTSSINQITTFTWYNKTMYYKKDLVLPKKKKKYQKYTTYVNEVKLVMVGL